jgi:hypothetical protein
MRAEPSANAGRDVALLVGVPLVAAAVVVVAYLVARAWLVPQPRLIYEIF